MRPQISALEKNWGKKCKFAGINSHKAEKEYDYRMKGEKSLQVQFACGMLPASTLELLECHLFSESEALL